MVRFYFTILKILMDHLRPLFRLDFGLFNFAAILRQKCEKLSTEIIQGRDRNLQPLN